MGKLATVNCSTITEVESCLRLSARWVGACDFPFQARTNEIVNFCGILRLQCLTFHSMVSAGDVKGAVKTHEGVMAWEGEG